MSNEELTNVDIVLYSLYLLGGSRRKIFTEDIAKKCFELAQDRFSWRRYPEYPDIEPARKSLMEARNQKDLISGRAGEVKGTKPSDGWIFSPEGVFWIEKNKSRIEKALGKKQKPIKRTELSKKIAELESSSAFLEFLKEKTCNNIKAYEFTDFLNVSLDTPSSVIKSRIQTVKALAASEKREKLLTFIALCEKNFSKLINN
ncbi:MAG: hypothetical protein HY344_02400 [Candidatus Levybacteria bacterium]|nr:hypothetical protein [Candidatus Levybacteria bacterium]